MARGDITVNQARSIINGDAELISGFVVVPAQAPTVIEESSSDYEGLFNAVLPVLSNGHTIEVILTEPPGTNYFKHTWISRAAGVYLAPGAKMTPYAAKAFVETYGAEIERVACAVMERVSPFAVGAGPKFHVYAIETTLLKWSLGSPYHRGLTEEYFTVAAVTYTASNGRFITIPITFGWETGKVEADFNADKVGR